MTTFDERQKAFEKKFASEQELLFKIIAKRNKMLGLWASERLHYDKEKAESYALEIIDLDLDEPGYEDVLDKIKADFENAGLAISKGEIQDKMIEFAEEARKYFESK